MEGHTAGHASGLAEGLAADEDKMNRPALSLIEAGRLDDIEKAAKDKAQREQLYKEYGI